VFTPARRATSPPGGSSVLTQENDPCVSPDAQRFKVLARTMIKERRGFIALANCTTTLKRLSSARANRSASPKAIGSTCSKPRTPTSGRFHALLRPRWKADKILYDGAGLPMPKSLTSTAYSTACGRSAIRPHQPTDPAMADKEAHHRRRPTHRSRPP